MSLKEAWDNISNKKLWNEKGEMQRPAAHFRNFIENKAGAKFLPEKGRYHLYVSYACPWAHRTLIVRKLKGLEDFIDVTSVHWHMSLTDSWRFITADETLPGDNCTPDPIHPDFIRLKELYLKANPEYTGRFSVPVLWDKKLETVVSNESSEIIRMLELEFDDLVPKDKKKVDLYPVHLRKDIEQVHSWMYEGINNGVYKCGMAKTQEAYSKALAELFSSLDKVEQQLGRVEQEGPYYFGKTMTEVDVRLFVTIIRFDPVYLTLFKTNRKMIRTGYPKIHKWVREIYWNQPAYKDTTQFEHIKWHYFHSLLILNPTGVVPEGPVPDIEQL